MSDSDLFQSALMKTVWATAHSHAFEAEIDAALEEAHLDPPFTTRQEYHPEFRGFSVKIDTIRVVPARWGLQLGDIANAFHSALDNLAWALVTRGKTPPSMLTDTQQRSVYFPICSSNVAFNKAIKTKLPGVRRGDIAKVRKAQPYARGKTKVSRHCFTTLQELSNADKHRTIQPVWLRPEGNWHEVLESRDCIVRRIRDMKPKTLKIDTEIARVYAKKTGPDPDIHLQGYVATGVALPNGDWLPNFLKPMREFTIQTMLQFAEPTFEFGDILNPGDFSGLAG